MMLITAEQTKQSLHYMLCSSPTLARKKKHVKRVQSKAEDIPSPDCRRKKHRARHEYKKNTAMADSLVKLYQA